jgi:tetratricopeptide (TPR) repeat protein
LQRIEGYPVDEAVGRGTAADNSPDGVEVGVTDQDDLPLMEEIGVLVRQLRDADIDACGLAGVQYVPDVHVDCRGLALALIGLLGWPGLFFVSRRCWTSFPARAPRPVARVAHVSPQLWIFSSNIIPMGGGTRQGAPAPGGTLELLALAAARPNEALAQARAIQARHPGPYNASIASQAVGIVLRDFGDADAAVRELRVALRLARAAGSRDRQADVLATLGGTLVSAGRTKSGLASLDAAVDQASGILAGRVLMRRGGTLQMLGRHREALNDLRRAVAVFRRADDTIWEARALMWCGDAHLALGATERADADFAKAGQLFAMTSQELESAYATQDRGMVAFRSGDLPAALSYLDEAARRYASLGAPVTDLSIDRCAVLLAAGLPSDALSEADAAVRGLEQAGGRATKRAELLLAAARAALAAADPQTALERAQTARRLFGAQQRAWWHAHAALMIVQARYATGTVSGRLLREAERATARLEVLGSGDTPLARLLAGRVALALGRAADADRHLAVAARIRRRGPALSRTHGWLAEAIRAEAADSPRRLFGACRHGFDILDHHRLTLGASELRAQATAQGSELAELAQRCALRSGRPRLLLEWSERWRSTALAVPPVRPPDDRELQADLTALRGITSRVEQARARSSPTAVLEREQLRLEGAIRARVMRAGGAGLPGGSSGPTGSPLDIAALLEALGAARLVQIADIGGDLHLLVCGAGKVRHFPAGRTEDAAREVDFARFGLNRLAHNRPADRPENALAILEATGRRLEDILLGNGGRHLGDGPVVIVPPGRLQAVPWALLPSLRDRVISVSPSARAWLRGRATPPPEGPEVVLVRGPGLGTGAVERLAAEYGLPILADGGATAARVLDAIDGARLVHMAAHGTFRADSPLFSSLRMHDGPLTVYDFERLRRAPYRVILPACDSGLLAPTGADELLGLTSSLVPLGTAGIIASVVRVNDQAADQLMLALHRRLRGGATLAESLRDARAELSGNAVQRATGWAFIALGAG